LGCLECFLFVECSFWKGDWGVDWVVAVSVLTVYWERDFVTNLFKFIFVLIVAHMFWLFRNIHHWQERHLCWCECVWLWNENFSSSIGRTIVSWICTQILVLQMFHVLWLGARKPSVLASRVTTVWWRHVCISYLS
jgi:hypothetical protein